MQKRKKQKRTAKLTVLESSATSVSNLLRLARGRSEDRNLIAKNRFLGPTRLLRDLYYTSEKLA